MLLAEKLSIGDTLNMKKRTLIIAGAVGLAVLLIIGIMAILQMGKSKNTIGKVYGAEHEFISIGGDTYTAVYDSNYSAKDRGRVLGRVVFENTETDPMIVYSIKGVEDNEYIYTLWVYDGCIYKKDSK